MVNRSKNKWLVFYVFIIILAFLFFKYIITNPLNVSIKRTINFEIKENDNFMKIANQICKEIDFLTCYKLRKLDINIIYPWNYTFKTWTKISQIIDTIKKPPYKKFTIYPWWTIYDIAYYISWYWLSDYFLEKVNNVPSWIINEFWKVKNLEWFLMPDTYFFSSFDKKFIDKLIELSLLNFKEKVIPLINCKDCNPYWLTKYEILIISSILEKEEFNIKNKPLVADILIRRYKNWWRLDADWTLCYWLKIPSKYCKYNIVKYLYDKNNPYNTRQNKWLPPTPVCNFSLNSLRAVLYPKKNKYWFYLHDKNWNIYFAETLEEHNKNKIKYLR